MDEGDRRGRVKRDGAGARSRMVRGRASLGGELTPDQEHARRVTGLEAQIRSLERKLARAMGSNRYLRKALEKAETKLDAKRAELEEEKAVTGALLDTSPHGAGDQRVEVLQGAVSRLRSELTKKKKRLRKNAEREKERRVQAMMRGLPLVGQYVAYAYIGGQDQAVALRVYLAVVDVLHALGVARVELIEAENGSLFVTMKAWFARLVGDPTTREFADQILQTAESLTVDKAQAESDSKRMAAIAQMVEAGAKADSLVIDLGTLQYAQYRGDDGTLHIAARSVSSRELATQRVSRENRENARAAYEEIAGSSDAGVIEVGAAAE